MAIDFPSSPTVGQVYAFAGVNYVFTAQGVWSTAAPAVTFDRLAEATPACGRLDYVAATVLCFNPYKGDRIRINGVIYPIPAAGVTSSPTAYVNGVYPTSLAAGTLYYVYMAAIGGVLIIDFSTTTHATSSTPGNIGTEIKSGDDTRTLIGMVMTSNTGTFTSQSDIRRVLSWFNRRNLPLVGGDTVGAATASTTPVELNTGVRAHFLCWAEEGTAVAITGIATETVAGANLNVALYLDSTTSLFVRNPSFTVASASYYGNLSGSHNIFIPEGTHWITPFGWVSNGGTGAFYVYCTAMIRG